MTAQPDGENGRKGDVRGLADLLALIRKCYERPKHRHRLEGLPMLCLVGEHHDGVLNFISDWLKGDGNVPRIPHALPMEPSGDIKAILLSIANGLSAGVNTRFKKLRFPRLRLACWLIDQDLAPDQGKGEMPDWDYDKVLAHRLRTRSGYRFQIKDMGGSPPWWLGLALNFLPLLPGLSFKVMSAGRRPLAPRFRFFLQQPYLSPRDPGRFIGFAHRLTIDGRFNNSRTELVEDKDELDKLLVNAFMEDLRREYRRWPWSFRHRHRTTYPIVLLKNIGERNGGYRLLELVNAVRNNMGGRFDPVLIITSSRQVPPDSRNLDDSPVRSAPEALSLFADDGQSWNQRLRSARRRREDVAWYLPIRAPRTGRDWRHPVPPKAPFWSQRWLPVGLVVVLVLACLWGGWRSYQAHCGQLWWPGRHRELRSIDGECVGLSTGDYHFGMDGRGGMARRLVKAEEMVHSQNRAADSQHRKEPDRPYVTLVYMGILSSNSDEALATPVQQVEGVATRQSVALSQHNSDDPLFRVLFANEGAGSMHGRTVAGMVTARARRDSRVVGVVGLDDSREVTIKAIEDLYSARLPIITPTLSYDRLTDVSPFYFQVNPGNKRESVVDAAFAKHRLHATSVQIYYTGRATDKYSTNLRNDLARRMRGAGITIAKAKRPDEFALGNRPLAAGRHACARPHSLVYYSGRGSDIEDFLTGMQENGCGSGRRPYVLADDDVSRYVADPNSRHQTPVPIYYGALSFVRRDTTAAKVFYRRLDKLFGDVNQRAETANSLDGHAALSYDATDAFADAIQHRRHIGSNALWRRLRAIDFEGVTGHVAFNDMGSERVPAKKQFGILHIDAASWKKPVVEGWCGESFDPKTQRYDTENAASWCGDVDRESP